MCITGVCFPRKPDDRLVLCTCLQSKGIGVQPETYMSSQRMIWLLGQQLVNRTFMGWTKNLVPTNCNISVLILSVYLNTDMLIVSRLMPLLCLPLDHQLFVMDINVYLLLNSLLICLCNVHKAIDQLIAPVMCTNHATHINRVYLSLLCFTLTTCYSIPLSYFALRCIDVCFITHSISPMVCYMHQYIIYLYFFVHQNMVNIIITLVTIFHNIYIATS
jgi:hypothetical protein